MPLTFISPIPAKGTETKDGPDLSCRYLELSSHQSPPRGLKRTTAPLFSLDYFPFISPIPAKGTETQIALKTSLFKYAFHLTNPRQGD